MSVGIFFFQAEDGIRDLVRSRGLGDVYKRQTMQGLAIFGGGSGRHPHKFQVIHPFVALEGTAVALSLIHI